MASVKPCSKTFMMICFTFSTVTQFPDNSGLEKTELLGGQMSHPYARLGDHAIALAVPKF